MLKNKLNILICCMILAACGGKITPASKDGEPNNPGSPTENPDPVDQEKEAEKARVAAAAQAQRDRVAAAAEQAERDRVAAVEQAERDRVAAKNLADQKILAELKPLKDLVYGSDQAFDPTPLARNLGITLTADHEAKFTDIANKQSKYFDMFEKIGHGGKTQNALYEEEWAKLKPINDFETVNQAKIAEYRKIKEQYTAAINDYLGKLAELTSFEKGNSMKGKDGSSLIYDMGSYVFFTVFDRKKTKFDHSGNGFDADSKKKWDEHLQHRKTAWDETMKQVKASFKSMETRDGFAEWATQEDPTGPFYNANEKIDKAKANVEKAHQAKKDLDDAIKDLETFLRK